MARTLKILDPDTQINVRLELVKTLVAIDGFVDLETTVQVSLLNTLTNYVLTGKTE